MTTSNEIKDGGLFAPPLPTDYRGSSSLLEWKEVNTIGDWSDYIPSGERQSRYNGDTMACASFSAINIIETQEKFLTGKCPNYSDRWIAKMSGTTKEGNYANKVAQTIREYGLVLEEDYPMVEPFNWDTYYADIPAEKLAELTAKGKKWLEKWSVQYEWVYYKNPFGADNPEFSKFLVLQELHHAPLQVLSKVCQGWSTVPIVQGCGQGSGHFTELYGLDTLDPEAFQILDTYVPFEKKLDINYQFQAILKIVLTRKKNMTLLNELEGKYIIRPESHGEVYKVVNGELVFLDSAKQDDGHIPLVDEVLRYAGKQGLFRGLTEEQFNSIK
jgi:hypothetical protein